MEDKETEFDCWDHSILKELQGKIETNKLDFDILLNFAI